jgi:hypothetical protein
LQGERTFWKKVCAANVQILVFSARFSRPRPTFEYEYEDEDEFEDDVVAALPRYDLLFE